MHTSCCWRLHLVIWEGTAFTIFFIYLFIRERRGHQACNTPTPSTNRNLDFGGVVLSVPLPPFLPRTCACEILCISSSSLLGRVFFFFVHAYLCACACMRVNVCATFSCVCDILWWVRGGFFEYLPRARGTASPGHMLRLSA